MRYSGILASLLSYILWALLPIYWKMFDQIPALEISAHRVFWVLPSLIPVLFFRGTGRKLIAALKDKKILAIHVLSGICILVNWLVYIWATINEHIIDAALGYYLNPFFYILVGSIFLGEKHNRLQITAIAIAGLGVAFQFAAIRGFPWIPISLATSFTVYGVVRKQSPMGSFSGLALESGLLMPFALIYLLWLNSQGQGAFGADIPFSFLLISTGAFTAIPLLLFAYGARKIPLSVIGILQFIVPTGQFLLGAFYYNEPLPMGKLFSFGLIWIAVIAYIISLRKGASKTNDSSLLESEI